MAKDVLIKNPDEQSAYQFIPGTTQKANPTGSVDPANYTFIEEQLFGDKQQPGNGEQMVSVVGPDGLPKVIPANMVAQGMEVVNQPTESAGTEQTEVVTTPETNQPTDAVTNTTGQEEDVTTQSTGQQQQVTTPKTHLYNWGGEGVTLESVLKGDGKDKPMSQIINDYYAWAGENGITPNVLDIYDAMRDKDASKSYAQNEQDEKKRLRKEKWNKVGMFLTHLGNAIGTYAGGGHAPLKLEDHVQWTERQRKLREATLAQRNAYNQSAFAMQTKMAAEQRAADMQKQQMEMKKAEQEQKAKIYALEEELTRARINGETKKADKIQAEIDRIKELTPYEIKVKEATAYKYKQGNKSGKTGGSGKGKTSTGTTSTTYDNEGNVKSVTVREPNVNKPSGNGTIKTGVTWKTKKK